MEFNSVFKGLIMTLNSVTRMQHFCSRQIFALAAVPTLLSAVGLVCVSHLAFRTFCSGWDSLLLLVEFGFGTTHSYYDKLFENREKSKQTGFCKQ